MLGKQQIDERDKPCGSPAPSPQLPLARRSVQHLSCSRHRGSAAVWPPRLWGRYRGPLHNFGPYQSALRLALDSRNWFCLPLDSSQSSSRISGPALLLTWPRMYRPHCSDQSIGYSEAYLSGTRCVASDRQVCAIRRLATNSITSGSWHKGITSGKWSCSVAYPVNKGPWTVTGFQTPRTLTADREPNGNKVFLWSTFPPSVPV